MQVNITVCGRPQAGKCTLAESFIHCDWGRPKIILEKHSPDRLFHIDIQTQNTSLRLRWAGGCVLYIDEVFQEVLHDADMVIYILPTLSDYFKDDEEYYAHYLEAASKVNKTPDQIPWIPLLNRRSGLPISKPPLIEKVPVFNKKTATECDLKDSAASHLVWALTVKNLQNKQIA